MYTGHEYLEENLGIDQLRTLLLTVELWLWFIPRTVFCRLQQLH